jgi:hypothetical protein
MVLHLQTFGDLRLIEANGDPLRSPIKAVDDDPYRCRCAMNSAVINWLSFCGATSKLEDGM